MDQQENVLFNQLPSKEYSLNNPTAGCILCKKQLKNIIPPNQEDQTHQCEVHEYC